MNEERFCFNCFRKLDEGVSVCPSCGYDEQGDEGKYPLALAHNTPLGGRYVTGRVLGQGGFGITYLALDWKTKERVAVKEYLPDGMATRTVGATISVFSGERGDSFQYGKECFLQEAQTLAAFNGNENIVRVHTYFEENGTAYFVMDYVEGTSFQSYLKERGGKIGWQEAEKIILPVMDALAAVHSKGIIHRDVTPDNIFITSDQTVKLLDFGAARYSLGDRSRSLDVVLKHGFAPKEQYTRHGRQGAYTDVYTLAATYYFAITGHKPPDSIDRMEEDNLIPPSNLGVEIPQELEDAILKALSVSAADRYPDMIQFKAAVLKGRENAEATPEPVPVTVAVTPEAVPVTVAVTPQPEVLEGGASVNETGEHETARKITVGAVLKIIGSIVLTFLLFFSTYDFLSDTGWEYSRPGLFWISWIAVPAFLVYVVMILTLFFRKSLVNRIARLVGVALTELLLFTYYTRGWGNFFSLRMVDTGYDAVVVLFGLTFFATLFGTIRKKKKVLIAGDVLFVAAVLVFAYVSVAFKPYV
jgi:serine/threonine protein kinase